MVEICKRYISLKCTYINEQFISGISFLVFSLDVLFYVEKRLNLEMDWAKNLTKLAQERRPVLKEESHLPFQSIYCFALDIVSINNFQ